MQTQKSNNSFRNKINELHQYYKISGFYNFFAKNIIKVLVGVTVFVIVFATVQHYVNIDFYFRKLVAGLSDEFVYALFFLSETFLGLIPPEIFVFWAKKFDHPYLITTLLGFMSYCASIVAFGIGKLFQRIPAINKKVEKKYEKHIDLITKWGGAFIFIAAFFPLPFALISTLAGLLNFPFRLFIVLIISRFIKYYFNAIILFEILS